MERKGNFENVETPKLEAMIQERLWLAKKVARLVQSLVSKYGTVLKRQEHRYYTNVEEELKGFAKFDFHCDHGKTEMGGNSIAISFNSQQVFNLYYSADLNDDLKIDYFDEVTPWLKKFEQAMKNRKGIISRMKLKKKIAAEKTQDDAADLRKRAALIEQAKNLGL
jgi:hypothetical protein